MPMRSAAKKGADGGHRPHRYGLTAYLRTGKGKGRRDWPGMFAPHRGHRQVSRCGIVYVVIARFIVGGMMNSLSMTVGGSARTHVADLLHGGHRFRRQLATGFVNQDAPGASMMLAMIEVPHPGVRLWSGTAGR